MTDEQLQGLYDKRATANQTASDVLSEVVNDDFTTDQQGKFDRAMADVDKFGKLINAQEQLRKAQAEEAARRYDERGEKNPDFDQEQDEAAAYTKAFRRMLEVGEHRLSSAEVELIHKRDQSTSPAEGGHGIPTTLSNRILEKMKFYGSILPLVTVENTASGNPMDFVTEDSSAAIGSLVGEAATSGTASQAYGKKTIGSYMFESGIFKMSVEILRDAQFDIDGRIANIAGKRLARIIDKMLVIGTGTNQPEGLATGAVNGHTAASATALTYDDIIDLQHSLDRSYRGNGSFIFNDSTLKILRKLKDADGRPLWQPSLVVGAPDQFAGSGYTINEWMPDAAAGEKAILYGDYSEYTARKVGGLSLVRFNELYMENRQVGLNVYQAYDGALLGLDGIKALTMAAS